MVSTVGSWRNILVFQKRNMFVETTFVFGKTPCASFFRQFQLIFTSAWKTFTLFGSDVWSFIHTFTHIINFVEYDNMKLLLKLTEIHSDLKVRLYHVRSQRKHLSTRIPSNSSSQVERPSVKLKSTQSPVKNLRVGHRNRKAPRRARLNTARRKDANAVNVTNHKDECQPRRLPPPCRGRSSGPGRGTCDLFLHWYTLRHNRRKRE